MWSLDCCEADFNEILAELEAEGLPKPNKINYAAVDRLMSEGHEEPLFIDRTPDHPQGD